MKKLGESSDVVADLETLVDVLEHRFNAEINRLLEMRLQLNLLV
jgi:hypothetical protein